MSIKIKFDLNSKFKDFMDSIHLRIKDMKENEYCKKEVDFFNQVSKKDPDITFQDLIDTILDDSRISQRSIHFVLNVLDKEGLIKQKLREQLIKKLKIPQYAFDIYLKCATLTDAEDKDLEAVFKDKLKRMEQELNDPENIEVKRAKDG